MEKASETIRGALETLFTRIDDIGDEIEDSREDLKIATRAHNMRVGELERERDSIRQEAGKLREALKVIENRQETSNDDA